MATKHTNALHVHICMCTKALAYQLTVDYLHYVHHMQKQLGLSSPATMPGQDQLGTGMARGA